MQRGNSCAFESIYQAVLPRWRLLRRRDGTQYTSDCRRAVFMNLRPSAHYPSLFRADPERAGAWRVCLTLEEAREATHAPLPQDVDSVDSDGDIAADVRHDALPGPGELVPLTELQTLISEAIASNGGSAPFDFIYDHVSRNRKKLKGRDGQPRNTDAKRAILASLSKNINSQPLFQRDARNPGAWMLGVYNPHYTRLNSAAATTASTTTAPDAEAPAALPTRAVPVSPAEPADAKEAKETNAPQREEVQVTDLHECMAEAIAASPLAVADAPQIAAFVTLRWPALLPRLAPSFQTTTPESAVHAALANVPSSLIRRLSSHHALYSLGKRGRVWATETGRMAQATPAAAVHAPPTAYASFAALIRKRCVEEGAVEVNVGEELAASPVDPATRLARPARPFKRRVEDAPVQERSLMAEAVAEAEAEADIEQAEADAAEEGEETALTDLQKLIWNGIEAHGGCATFDQVVNEVAKSYGNLRRRDGSPYHSDCRRSVQASLSAHPHHPGRVFVRHATNKDLWLIAPEARSRAPRDLPPQPGGPLLESDSSASHSPMSTSSVPRAVPPSLALSTAAAAAARPSGPASSLTDMQKLLIRIIMNAGGAAAFQHIIEQVSRQWSSLKRRDGSSYSSDSVRAVKASLSNNTYSVPIFKRDARNADLWLVADRSFADLVLSEDAGRPGAPAVQPCSSANCGADSDVSLSVSDESAADVMVGRRRTK